MTASGISVYALRRGSAQEAERRRDSDTRGLTSEYVDMVINSMPSNPQNPERRKEVAEQKEALQRLKLVMESRLRSESSNAKGLAFGASLDDDEVLLRLMREVDKDKSGSISEEELLASPLLNAEMKKALQSAFACNLEAMEDAMAHISAEEICEYKREGEPCAAGDTFNQKASVKALFDALDPSGSGWVKRKGLVQLAEKFKMTGSEMIYSALTGLACTLPEEDVGLDFLAIKRAARRVPRLVGQRIDWVRGMGLDALLARHLPPGTLEDGLAAVRSMPYEETKQAVAAYLEDAKVKIFEALLEAKEAKGSRSAAEANSKFQGFEGNFASLKEFHAGAEASLNLGYPNPDTMKGIRLEHTKHVSVEKLYLTPNYRIVTNLLIEYAWALYEADPTDSEVKELLQRSLKLLRKLAMERENHAHTNPDHHIFFPGEVGDSFSESLVILKIPGVLAGSAVAKTGEDAAKTKAVDLLMTDEEKVRGVSTLDHQACIQRIRVLSDQEGQTAAMDDSLRVGLLLPMSLGRAEAIRDKLLTAVAAAVGGREVVADKVIRCTWTFSRFTGVKELRKWIEERSMEELTTAIAAEEEAWGFIPVADQSTHEALCKAMVASFVCKELRADFLTALQSSASEAQIRIKTLVEGWNTGRTMADGADWIAEAANALDSEERWKAVEKWVQLYCGRIQGRTRLGLKGLMKREQVKIKQYRLKDSEVLGLYLYTGPGRQPM